MGANSPVDDRQAPDRGNGYAVALAWTALEPRPTADAIFELNRAAGWDDFREAASKFAAPSQNMVYADREGHIGYQAPGLIPIRKSPAWWALTQDERRQVMEEQSRHIRLGMNYLPQIARRLHHCRDLSDSEPFDFLTWFEFAPRDAGLFDELLAALRASPEWAYVERETDIRLTAAP